MSTRYTQGTPRTYTTDVIVLVSKRAVVRLIFSNCCEPFPDAAVDRVITSVASRLTFYQQATVPLPAVPGFVEEPDSGTGSGSGSRVV